MSEELALWDWLFGLPPRLAHDRHHSEIEEIEMLSELLSKMRPEELIGLTAVVLGISAGIIISLTAIICGTVSRYRQRQLAADLIHDLADRGMSAEEIERLLRASAVDAPRHAQRLRHLLRQEASI